MSTHESAAAALTEARPPGSELDQRLFADVFDAVAANIEQVIQGKREVIELALVCLLADGHLLLEDVPGVGKTSLAKAIATTLGVTWRRIQFTPDLLPGDVVGVTVWNRGTSGFEFRPGPVFANVVLGDEINRASPKTQSALLEAMQERQVTIDGVTYPLAPPFIVIATQNPIEHEGTYPLPEAQLDRFLMRIAVGYPGRQAEIEILESHGDVAAGPRLRAVSSAAEVSAMARAVRHVHVAPALREYLVDLAEASRRHPALSLGMSPRATLGLQRATRALAAARGRTFATPDDVKDLAVPVLAHRLSLRPEAQMEGSDAASVVTELLGSVAITSAGGGWARS